MAKVNDRRTIGEAVMVTLDSFKKDLIEDNKTKTTIKNYLSDVKGFANWFVEDEGTPTTRGNGGSNMVQKANTEFTQNFSNTVANNVQQPVSTEQQQPVSTEQQPANNAQQSQSIEDPEALIGKYTNKDGSFNAKHRKALTESAKVVREYVEMMKNDRNLAPTTTNRHIISLRQFFQFAWSMQLFDDSEVGNIGEKLKVKRIQKGGQSKVKWLRRDEVEAIIEGIDAMNINDRFKARNRAVILTFVNCGLRVSELSELRVRDINFDEHTLIVNSGKGDKYRIVPLSEGTMEAINAWFNYRTEDGEILPDDYVFISERSPRFSPRGIQHLTKGLSEITGIEFSPHTLRHTYCKQVADSTGKIEVVASLAGHSNINTTKIYTQPSIEELNDVVKGIEFR